MSTERLHSPTRKSSGAVLLILLVLRPCRSTIDAGMVPIDRGSCLVQSSSRPRAGRRCLRRGHATAVIVAFVGGLALATPLAGASRQARVSRLAEPIAYTLRFPAPATHYVEVEARIPTSGQGTIELMMAVWTPGSYLVREYERNVEALSVRRGDGKPLPIEKTRKNRWRIQTGGAPSVTATYRVYCREMNVRSNWVEEGFAMLNGAPTFLTLADGVARPHDVRVLLPAGWKKTLTALAAAPDGDSDHYVAPDFDTLADSPIIAGSPAVYEFEVEGKKHYLVNAGDDSLWDTNRTVTDMTAIVGEWRRMWGFLPYQRYLFLNVITDTDGGLEHKDSTLLMSGRAQTRTRHGYLEFLTLVSHEYLHAWNVKRLRPVELGPFDYENENYTRNLWVAEGFTDYYGELALPRAKLATTEEFLEMLSNRIETLQTTPGRLVQPLQQSSFDAWIKEYRPDENSATSAISYYTKGGAVAFLLDAKIQRATAGGKCLDDAMRLAYQRYSGARGFTTREFRETMQEVAGVDLSAWFAAAVDSTNELDYREAFDWFGFRFKEEKPPKIEGHERAFIGIGTRIEDGRIIVSQVVGGTPAHDAGVNVDDEIVAIGEYRVRPGQLEERIALYRPGDRISLLVARRERLLRLELTLGEAPGKRWMVEMDPDATPEQKAHLKAWLRQE
jgi:predicted metalloprotease with PDZ domain